VTGLAPQPTLKIVRLDYVCRTWVDGVELCEGGVERGLLFNLGSLGLFAAKRFERLDHLGGDTACHIFSLLVGLLQGVADSGNDSCKLREVFHLLGYLRQLGQ